ncbi:hypothetical protein [Falsiroseomonas sp.]|uniref:hypothetical protein n=1 Tax=Falsiroseomonas sp. TaxID=2870721 RepID=UPI003563863A
MFFLSASLRIIAFMGFFHAISRPICIKGKPNPDGGCSMDSEMRISASVWQRHARIKRFVSRATDTQQFSLRVGSLRLYRNEDWSDSSQTCFVGLGGRGAYVVSIASRGQERWHRRGALGVHAEVLRLEPSCERWVRQPLYAFSSEQVPFFDDLMFHLDTAQPVSPMAALARQRLRWRNLRRALAAVAAFEATGAVDGLPEPVRDLPAEVVALVAPRRYPEVRLLRQCATWPGGDAWYARAPGGVLIAWNQVYMWWVDYHSELGPALSLGMMPSRFRRAVRELAFRPLDEAAPDVLALQREARRREWPPEAVLAAARHAMLAAGLSESLLRRDLLQQLCRQAELQDIKRREEAEEIAAMFSSPPRQPAPVIPLRHSTP